MFLRTILFIGIHLLCFTNVANPMVLLTANVEDIKRIARKFLSDNVADTIAEFLLKATGGLRNKDQLSEENDQNQQDINNLSVEGKIDRATKRRPTTANHFVDYDVKTTSRPNNNIAPELVVYNTPAFERDAERLDGDFDEDFRTDTTANDDTLMKQRDFRQREDKDEKYDDTNTKGGYQYDVEIHKPRHTKYNADEDEEPLSTTTSSPYSKSGKHRVVASEGEDQYDVETKKPRQPRYSAEEEESLPKPTSSQYSKMGKHRLIATSGSIILPRIGD